MLELVKTIIQMTAWPMTPQKPYSAFHILLTISGVFVAVISAVGFQRKMRKTAEPAQFFRHVLFALGVILAVMELYKQVFLYLIEFNGQFDWWYFPFQLCSVPMYLCLIVPLLRKEACMEIIAIFLQDFGILGGVMALAVPPGLMHPYWTMTMHGFIWHFMLLFLGFFCSMSGRTGRKASDYIRVLPLFLSCCALAFGINVLVGPTGDADMFYLSPYHLSCQPIFHEISAAAGIIPSNLLYVAAMTLGGFIIHMVFISARKMGQRDGSNSAIHDR